MTYAEKLPQVLQWVRSHGERLKRPGFESPNHLANGTVRVYCADTALADFELALDAAGAPPDLLPSHPVHRLEVRDCEGMLLFAEDYPQWLA